MTRLERKNGSAYRRKRGVSNSKTNMISLLTKIRGRRLKVLRIANPILVSMLRQGAKQRYMVIENGLPKDAKIVNIQFGMGDYFDVLIESKEFNRVPFGKEIPEMKAPTVTVI